MPQANFIYVDKQNNFYRIHGNEAIADDSLLKVPTQELPLNGNHKWDWDNSVWVAKTQEEIDGETLEEDIEELTEKEVATSDSTSINAIALWGDTGGESLKNSPVEIDDSGSFRLYDSGDRNNPGVVFDSDGRLRLGKNRGDSPDSTHELFVDGSLNLQNGFFYVNGNPLTLANFIAGEPFEGAVIVYKDGIPTWGLPPFTWAYSVAINSRSVSNQYLRRQNGTLTSDCTYVMGFSARIERITMENRYNDNDDWDLRIFKNGSSVGSFYKPSNQTNKVKVFTTEDIDITLDRGDAFYLYCDNRGSGNISNPGSSLYFREIFD